MTFQQLTYLVEISKCGSINKAARKLFLSQSGISTAIRDLENELGIQFFLRNNRGVEFTPEGKEFLNYAILMLDQKHWVENLYEGSRHPDVTSRFAVSSQRYPFAEQAFLQMLQGAEEDQFQYALKEVNMYSVVEDVYDHRADIGVIFFTDVTEKMIRRLLDSRGLEFHLIASVPPCVYFREGHPMAVKATMRESDLIGYPYVTFEHEQGVALEFTEEYKLMSVQKPEKTIIVSSRSAMFDVLKKTNAYTTGSGLLTETNGGQEIVTIPLEGDSHIHIGWIFPCGGALTSHGRHFVELLEKSLADSIEYSEKLRKSRGQHPQ